MNDCARISHMLLLESHLRMLLGFLKGREGTLCPPVYEEVFFAVALCFRKVVSVPNSKSHVAPIPFRQAMNSIACLEYDFLLPFSNPEVSQISSFQVSIGHFCGLPLSWMALSLWPVTQPSIFRQLLTSWIIWNGFPKKPVLLRITSLITTLLLPMDNNNS